MMHIIMRITQHDNKACLDRTVENITTLSNRKFNILYEICLMVVKAKRSIQYHVGTIHSQLEGYYQHWKKNLVHGSGQDSGKCKVRVKFYKYPIT